ncbi:chemotaxis protein CheW [Bordetella genomosp. 1]|uniref:Chemotaxis protein CheW n=1 Tax=Bordetella genomosp. 1 TaxID=1395607 RepID=A0A261S7M6_9BORD|nr:chemotaxis protein CheW [Bordetella genomosp. 1]MDQ8034114.1 chemotaxis protein CheW [Bordetella sp.]OZI33121.1 chemotaxis protein CheW [Bordetella genomosp. 1]OZI57228.1 chemotaxis protein CheW [Bordetella genomosp. 1]
MANLPAAAPPTSHIGGRRLYLLFRIGGDRYALEARDILAVRPLVPFKAIPGAPAWVAGVFEHDGTPVPVVDVSALAGAGAAPRLTSTRLALARYNPDPGGPTQVLGLLLAGATETAHFDPSAFQPSGVHQEAARYLGPVISDALGMVQKVYVQDLLTDEARAMLFAPAGEGA